MKNVKPGHARPRVLIDPGHYGSNYNRGAAAGYYESKAMWQLSQYEKSALEAYGIEAALTRSNINDNPGLIQRGKMAKDYDLAYSNHSNGGGDGKAAYSLGIYFVDDNCGAVDEQSKEFARLMSGVVAETMPPCSSARIWTRSSDYDRDGNGYKDDWYGFLRGAHSVGTTAAIIEHGFHDHQQSAAWLLVDANLKKLAEAKAAKIAEWFDVSKVETPTTPAPTTTKKGDTYTMEMRILKKGCEGEDVRAAQILLNGRGFDCGKADGIFGDRTEDAVDACQKKYGLTRDKIIGPDTMGALLGQ